MWIKESDSFNVQNISQIIDNKFNIILKKYPNLSNDSNYLLIITCIEIINEMQNANKINAVDIKTEKELEISNKNNNQINNNLPLFKNNNNFDINTLKTQIEKEMINDLVKILEHITNKINF